MNNILGYTGNLFFFYGAFAFSRKHISAWYAQIIANLFYIFQSLNMQNYPLFWLSIILIGINIYGLWKWRKQSQNDSLEQKIKKEAGHSYLIETMKHVDGRIE